VDEIQITEDPRIFFGCQIKKEKIDAAGKSDANIAGILNQITMMLDHPIWDPANNRNQLLDHVYIISGGEITKQAKNWLGQGAVSALKLQVRHVRRWAKRRGTPIGTKRKEGGQLQR
jgi:hypothetical protein